MSSSSSLLRPIKKPDSRSQPQVKVERYRAGKAPSFAKESEESESETEESHQVIAEAFTDVVIEPQRSSVSELVVTGSRIEAKDKRLERLAALRVSSDSKEEEEEEGKDSSVREKVVPQMLHPRQARLHRAQTQEESIIITKQETPATNQKDLSLSAAEKRKQAKEKALKRQQMSLLSTKEYIFEETEVPLNVNAEVYAEQSESEEEEKEQIQQQPTLIKPAFVPKERRVYELEKQVLDKDEEEEILERKKAEEIERRKKEAAYLLAESIQKELAQQQGLAALKITDAETIDDTDLDGDEEELEAWKLRELLRIKRDQEERQRLLIEREEIERIRNLPEEEKEAFIKEKLEEQSRVQKTDYKFLQKYYHKGVFYMDSEDPIYKRDYNLPTLEDRVDKTILPDAMQVKNFGKMGRTKWTHLSAEDTTAFDGAWYQESEINEKATRRMGGMHGALDRPLKKKKL